MRVRRPAVAGAFYPASAKRLRDDVASYLATGKPRVKAIAVLSPHAGYMYSGPVAGAVFSAVEVPRDVVVLAVNHRGIGARAAVQTDAQWRTPLGDVPVAEDLAERIKREVAGLEEDASAHADEHSLEVQLPFLQVLREDLRIVPIVLSHLGLKECEAFGDGLARAISGRADPALIVASTDMSHYVSADAARREDFLALDQVLKLDPAGLYNTVAARRISMCGVIPGTVALRAARALGASRADIVMYDNSGTASGDQDRVVGYAGVAIG